VGPWEREIAAIESRRKPLQESRASGALRGCWRSGPGVACTVPVPTGGSGGALAWPLQVAAGGRLGQVVVDTTRSPPGDELAQGPPGAAHLPAAQTRIRAAASSKRRQKRHAGAALERGGAHSRCGSADWWPPRCS